MAPEIDRARGAELARCVAKQFFVQRATRELLRVQVCKRLRGPMRPAEPCAKTARSVRTPWRGTSLGANASPLPAR
eukprot:13891261-Alexandrium_andersonii.AAC.1